MTNHLKCFFLLSLFILLTVGLTLAADPQKPNQTTKSSSYNQNRSKEIKDRPIVLPEEGGTNQAATKKEEKILTVNEIKDKWDYALILFTILFTGGLVWIGARQIVWMRRTQEATKLAATAAIQSAEVAQLALKADRPFIILLVSDLTSYDRGPEGILEGAKFQVEDLLNDSSPSTIGASGKLRNGGKGPAIIESVTGNIIKTKDGVYPEVGDFSDCRDFDDITSTALAAGDVSEYFSSCPFELRFTKEDFDPIRRGKEKIIFYGRIEYRDIFATTYYTTFLFVYDLRFERFEVGPKEHNQHTEKPQSDARSETAV